MNEVSKTRLVASLILLTIGCGLLLIHYFLSFGLVLICVSTCITSSAKERSHPTRRVDFLWFALVLLGFLAIGLAGHYWASSAFVKSANRAVFHPAFAVSLWIVGLWVTCRRWKRANRNAQAAFS